MKKSHYDRTGCPITCYEVKWKKTRLSFGCFYIASSTCYVFLVLFRVLAGPYLDDWSPRDLNHTACVIKNSNLKKFTGELFKIAFYYLNLRLIKVNRSDACCLFLKRLYLQKYFLIWTYRIADTFHSVGTFYWRHSDHRTSLLLAGCIFLL